MRVTSLGALPAFCRDPAQPMNSVSLVSRASHSEGSIVWAHQGTSSATFSRFADRGDDIVARYASRIALSPCCVYSGLVSSESVLGLGGEEIVSAAPSRDMTANFVGLLEARLGLGVWNDPVASRLARPLDAVLAYLPPEGSQVRLMYSFTCCEEPT